ncbi:MAG: cupin domain-containing protein [Myxococcota bacterium]
MTTVKDATSMFAAERRAYLGKRPGFHINELQLGPTQSVPWHYHNTIQDTFYVIEGRIRLHLRQPDEQVVLGPAETYSVSPKRPHLVTNDTDDSSTFLVLQGIGEYDFVLLDE